MSRSIELSKHQWSPLHFITNGDTLEAQLRGAQMALAGGCRWIQLRMKEFSREQIVSVVLLLKPQCKQYNAVLIIDDHVDIALEYQLDGVHLGLNDMPIDEARVILGNDYIIGGTANTLAQAQHQISCGADYLGIGPYRFTSTKKNLSPILGIEGYASIVGALGDNHIPIVAIGGIEIQDIMPIMATGVDGIAISGTILRAENPIETTCNILKKLDYERFNNCWSEI